MLRERSFTLTAMGSLALGIAATTAMFSVVYAVIIDPFPYREVASLASIKVWEPGTRGSRTFYTVDQYLELGNAARSSTASSPRPSATSSGRVGRRPNGCAAITGLSIRSTSWASLLSSGERQAGDAARAPPVVVLGYRFWQRQFGGDPSPGPAPGLNGVFAKSSA